MLAARTAHLSVTSNAAGADIILNDTPVGTALLAEPLVDAGDTASSFARAGYVSRIQQVKLAGGDASSITAISRSSRDVIVERGQEPIVREERPSWLWASWTATGGHAAGAVATGVFGISGRPTRVRRRERSSSKPARPSSRISPNQADTLLLVADIAGAAAVVAGGILPLPR